MFIGKFTTPLSRVLTLAKQQKMTAQLLTKRSVKIYEWPLGKEPHRSNSGHFGSHTQSFETERLPTVIQSVAFVAKTCSLKFAVECLLIRCQLAILPIIHEVTGLE